jgi:hypothetical protein
MANPRGKKIGINHWCSVGTAKRSIDPRASEPEKGIYTIETAAPGAAYHERPHWKRSPLPICPIKAQGYPPTTETSS